jgi:hypothetical protein
MSFALPTRAARLLLYSIAELPVKPARAWPRGVRGPAQTAGMPVNSRPPARLYPPGLISKTVPSRYAPPASVVP